MTDPMMTLLLDDLRSINEELLHAGGCVPADFEPARARYGAISREVDRLTIEAAYHHDPRRDDVAVSTVRVRGVGAIRRLLGVRF